MPPVRPCAVAGQIRGEMAIAREGHMAGTILVMAPIFALQVEATIDDRPLSEMFGERRGGDERLCTSRGSPFRLCLQFARAAHSYSADTP